MIWFTGDLHFDHRRILEHHPDRGACVEEMNERIVANWNAVVASRDEVWVLGDFHLGPSANIGKWFHALHGSKHLVAGNHDHNATKRLPWSSVDDYREWKQKPHRAVLSHYPMLTWNGAHHGVWMLHGHSHGMLRAPRSTRMDVGIDTHPEFRPWSLDEVVAEMAGRTYVSVDHHGERHE